MSWPPLIDLRKSSGVAPPKAQVEATRDKKLELIDAIAPESPLLTFTDPQSSACGRIASGLANRMQRRGIHGANSNNHANRTRVVRSAVEVGTARRISTCPTPASSLPKLVRLPSFNCLLSRRRSCVGQRRDSLHRQAPGRCNCSKIRSHDDRHTNCLH